MCTMSSRDLKGTPPCLQNIYNIMELFNGVRKLDNNLYRAMIYVEGKHVHLIDTHSEQEAEETIDNFLYNLRKINNKTN